ncbi:hypothetical protein AGR4C_Lc40293 [Agrobacterium tumefaciens str. Kerr 14]|uniref:Uncharacterized protein n=1 Tax=Agrobacterium tumefaciens str. Kerr 14 TaxID=1183424 RepID=A0A1S7RPS5_AGRTU|nr:hypothetical protein AGR4C_Lc40293 [Agrobacterium tumefaciens str. Kerr 14]
MGALDPRVKPEDDGGEVEATLSALSGIFGLIAGFASSKANDYTIPPLPPTEAGRSAATCLR